MLFFKALGLLPFVAMALAGPSKFANTCRDIDGEGTTLRAQCQERKDGQYRFSTVDLNRCIKNDKGTLKCGKNGHYSNSCISCSLRGTAEFTCLCRDSGRNHDYVPTTLDLSKYSYVPTTIDLNKCISNDHGNLHC